MPESLQSPAERLINAMTSAALQASMLGNLCPACGDLKPSQKPFCRGCWGMLPGELQRRFAREPEHLAAMFMAMRYLDAWEFLLPVEAGGIRKEHL